jgi:hypothetical protein
LGCQISTFLGFILFLDPKKGTKIAVRFVLNKTQVFSVEICIGGTIGMSNINIFRVYFVPGPQKRYQNCRQIRP